MKFLESLQYRVDKSKEVTSWNAHCQGQRVVGGVTWGERRGGGGARGGERGGAFSRATEETCCLVERLSPTEPPPAGSPAFNGPAAGDSRVRARIARMLLFQDSFFLSFFLSLSLFLSLFLSFFLSFFSSASSIFHLSFLATILILIFVLIPTAAARGQHPGREYIDTIHPGAILFSYFRNTVKRRNGINGEEERNVPEEEEEEEGGHPWRCLDMRASIF